MVMHQRICLLVSLILFLGQHPSNPAFAQSRWTGGLHISSRITNGNNYSQRDIRQDTGPDFINGIGISLLRFRTPRTFYQTGLHYLRKSVSLNNEPDYRLFLDNAGGSEFVEVGIMDWTRHFSSLSLPVQWHYKVFNREGTNLIVGGGASFKWLFHTVYKYNSTYDGAQRRAGTRGFSKESVSGLLHAGIGLYQPVGAKYVLLLQPQFIWGLTREEDREGKGKDNSFMLQLELHRRW